jgi:hypothetical protein
MKFAFLDDFQSSLICLLFCYQPGVEVGVDGHLLAGHSIECESGGDFADSFRAFGNYDELDNDQYQENHYADNETAARDEVAECLDDFACVALKEYQSR